MLHFVITPDTRETSLKAANRVLDLFCTAGTKCIALRTYLKPFFEHALLPSIGDSQRKIPPSIPSHELSEVELGKGRGPDGGGCAGVRDQGQAMRWRIQLEAFIQRPIGLRGARIHSSEANHMDTAYPLPHRSCHQDDLKDRRDHTTRTTTSSWPTS